MSDNVFSGNLYLVEAKGDRQAVVPHLHGSPKNPITFVNENGAKINLAANESFFGFNDKFNVEEIDVDGQKQKVISVDAYQIDADAKGELSNLSFAPLKYTVSFAKNASNKPVVKYTLTKESIKDLAELDMKLEFPLVISDVLTTSHPLIVQKPEGYAPDENNLHKVSFPPHHPGGAIKMRAVVEATPSMKLPTTISEKISPKTGTNTVNKHAPTAPTNPTYSDRQVEAIIRDYCEDLSVKAENGKLDPVIGRGEETVQAIKVMGQRKQASLCFTGEAGIGKTAMFSAVAQYIADGEQVPEHLEGARVLQLDIQSMLSGSKFRGQFEERLKPLIDGLKEREGFLKGRKVILAIDEIAEQLSAGKGTEGGGSAGGMLKPFLTAQGIACMGTTTLDEYRKTIEKDPALARRFDQLTLSQPKFDETLAILKGLWPNYKEHHNLSEDISDDDLAYIVHMTDRYAPNQAQPNKAEKCLDMAGSSASFRHDNVISRDDILSAVAKMSKLSKDFLSQDDHARFLEMQEKLPEEVLGQPGLQKIMDGLIGARSGLNDPNQPWGAFVLQGPTGTGKTETAKALARYLFGDEKAMVKLDMSEYAEKHSVSRLIGAPPGYVGFNDSEPALTEKIRQRPYSILLLDEIEKAHEDVFNVFLSIFNDGEMKDNKGKTVQFNNVIILMTSNLGAKKVMDMINSGGTGSIAFGASSLENDPEAQEKALTKIYSEAFNDKFSRPELRNRIEELGGFVTFLPLSTVVIEKLVSRELGKINERLSDKTGAGLTNVSVEISQAVNDQLAEEGYRPDMGARPLRKVVREKIGNPLGKWLMANKSKLEAFVAKNGSAKIKINALDEGFAPKIIKGDKKLKAQTAFNDNNKKPASDDIIISRARSPKKKTVNKPKK